MYGLKSVPTLVSILYIDVPKLSNFTKRLSSETNSSWWEISIKDGQLYAEGVYGFSALESKYWFENDTNFKSLSIEKESQSEEKPDCSMNSSIITSLSDTALANAYSTAEYTSS